MEFTAYLDIEKGEVMGVTMFCTIIVLLRLQGKMWLESHRGVLTTSDFFAVTNKCGNLSELIPHTSLISFPLRFKLLPAIVT